MLSTLARLAKSGAVLAVTWFACFSWVMFGAGVLSALELATEDQRTTEYCATVQELLASANATETSRWSELLAAVSSAGICRQPDCSSDNMTAANATVANATETAFTVAAEREALRLNWSLPGAIFFCMTTVTTIGYGTFVPTTTTGRLFVVPFALVGIPLFTMSNGMLALRLHAVAGAIAPRKLRALGSECAALLVLLVLWCTWMSAWGSWFGEREGWGTLAGFWFAFNTCTTLGLGDYAPTAGATRDNPLTYLFVFGGLSLFGAVLISVLSFWGGGAPTDHVGVAREKIASTKRGVARHRCSCRARLEQSCSCLRAAQSWVLVFSYMVLGGAVMSAIEGGGKALSADLFSNSLSSLQPGGESFSTLADATVGDNGGKFSLLGSVHHALSLLDATGTCPPPDDTRRRWSILPASKYAFSLFTTIGWGDLAPSTAGGKLFSMPYMLLGLALFANASATTATMVHRRIVRKMLRFEEKHGRSGQNGSSFWQTSCCFRLRYVFLGVGMLLVWWVMSTFVFAATEVWTLGECAWFALVAITTLGFGDFSPSFLGKSFFVQWAVLTLGLKMFALVKQGASVTTVSSEEAEQIKKAAKALRKAKKAEKAEEANMEKSEEITNPAAAGRGQKKQSNNPLGLDADTLAVLDRSKVKGKTGSPKKMRSDARTVMVL